ncbi:MAG: 30S ribosomal protein S7 [Anaerolineae bacterium]|nr:30S ribosomal protein S7 [Anaerolineae bacterium]MCB9132773.1 30S ribosomal protein S7 [Anaerolineales bacterium]MCB0229662.1 30S ribosomal protein S7 [Anaerolineae bacterium]MCB0232756.1 30S ribosomal protein S7 [Anaerolineae bacterium]MCB0239095.1 30S ribosomal protein S7 [Anaerolineae bacterium]
MRRNRAPIRTIAPDPKYNNVALAKFINRIMLSGKKSTAQTIVYDSLEILEKRTGKPAIEVFEQAINNASPAVEVKPRRVGGATYQVPLEVPASRRQALAHRWLIANARKRSGKSMAQKLAAELLDASNNTGTTIKRKEDTHKMAEANRAFAHYRWGGR